ncbi:MAG: hypothetical protein NTV81_00015 [Candidatus Komeilibacteria bacterium]|nr:hypothetical protein [Candidatus Komeilibacteria bacterium]
MVNPGKHWEASKKELREVHFTPPDFAPPISLLIYDDKIAICGSQTENFGLVIESELIKQTFNTLFDFFWQITPVAKPNDQ